MACLQARNLEEARGQATFAVELIEVGPLRVGNTDVEKGLEGWRVARDGVCKLLQNCRKPALDILGGVVVREATPSPRNRARTGVRRMPGRQFALGKPNRAVIDQT